MTKALVTGGAGFIGSHLVDALLAKGWTVTAIDDLSTGSVENIAHLKTHPRFSYVEDTVMNQDVMEGLVEGTDVVFHLAAAVGVRLIIERPVHTISTNIKAAEIVLELCAGKGKPVLMTSTSEVYGKLDRPKFSEEDDLVLGPSSRSRWCYAASKIVDEFLAKAYFEQYGLPVVVVRLFNTIGPRQSGQYGMVVPRFVRQAILGDPITVHGDGTQRRSFTWMGDAVSAMIALIEEPKAQGQIVNIGHNKDVSIRELAELVKALTESTSDIVMVSHESVYAAGFEDMQRRMPDLSRIQGLIGYRPSLELAQMLERIIDYERERLGTEAYK